MAIVKPKKKKMGDIITETFLSICLIVVIVVCIYPFWRVIMYSLSDSKAAMSGGIFLIPKELTIATYKVVFQTKRIFVAFGNSLMKTVVGTGLAMIVTVLTAYPLSRSELRGRRGIMLFIYFTMLFSGGMIPNYLLYKDLHLLDSFWVYVIPSAMSAYNMFILRSFFASIPASLPESAMLDGANPMQILWWIMLPLSKSALATIALYYVQGFWNSYMDGVLYVTTSRLELLQVYLRNLISSTGALAAMGELPSLSGGNTITEESMKMTVIAISVIPVILVYLFLQKYFQKGINEGAIKG